MSGTTTATNSDRALVLGGGGPVGVAWELGLAAGLAEAGVRLADADKVIGTSAGSITGALLAGGDDPAEVVTDIESLLGGSAVAAGADAVSPNSLMEFMEMILNAGSDDDAERIAELQRAGRFALDAATIPEEAFVAAFSTLLGGRQWPRGFSCTAVDANSGEFRVWDGDSAAPLDRAVASSCTVPGIYPPVTIDGARYIDGGTRSPLNADLAAGFGRVVVISVMAMELPAGFDDPRFERFLATQRGSIEALRASGSTVETIVPDLEFLTLSGLGMNLMDFTIIGAAAEAGMRLGKLEAQRIATMW